MKIKNICWFVCVFFFLQASVATHAVPPVRQIAKVVSTGTKASLAGKSYKVSTYSKSAGSFSHARSSYNVGYGSGSFVSVGSGAAKTSSHGAGSFANTWTASVNNVSYGSFPKTTTTATKSVSPSISVQKQAGHVPRTPQHANRVKQGTPTTTFFGEKSGAYLTKKAYEKGTPVPKRPQIREHDFGVSVGTGSKGGMQTKVRVHKDTKGKIHGYPSGPERY